MSKNNTPEEPYSSQVLRELHGHTKAQTEQYSSFMEHLEDRKTQDHVLKKLDSLVKERAEIEKLHNAKHPGQEPLERHPTDDQWMEDDEDEGSDDHHKRGSYDDGREVPTEDEVAKGMRAQDQKIQKLRKSLENLSGTLGAF